jgi:hypothetical protein
MPDLAWRAEASSPIFLQAQIVARDALRKFDYKVARRCGVLTFFDHFQVIILAVVCGVVTSKKSPRSQRCIKVDPATLERRHHQIPADQGERSGVAKPHRLCIQVGLVDNDALWE